MTKKRFIFLDGFSLRYTCICDNQKGHRTNGVLKQDEVLELLNHLHEENEQLKSQLYCDEEEGVCNICKHHYLIKDDEAELGYYNSRCKKGHYECARVSLKHCEDFEKELEE